MHKKLIDKGLFHKVYVIGDGEERDFLKKLVQELQVEDTFIFLGKKENPYPYIKQADYFALLSYYEGYGMVLEEAKILNKKIIITDTAAKEAVQDYEKAIILPNNEESILEGLEKIIQNFKKRTVPKKKGPSPKKKDRPQYKISILTATYNREKYLPKLYKSILSQKETVHVGHVPERNGPFGTQIEWIIIDDGSTDNTKELVNKWIKENKIEIKYIYQKNSGKMSAINSGMEEVTGELVIDCDSDDYFSKDAFKIIEQNIDTLLNDEELYGLCFLKQDKSGNISGKKFKTSFMKTTMFDLYFKDDIQGEKILVFNSKIRKKFKHELEGEEKFITEARLYHKMDKNYKILCINEAIEIGNYEDDGYTKNIRRTFYEAPKGYYKFFKEMFWKALFKANVKKKIYVVKHFIWFWILNNKHKR